MGIVSGKTSTGYEFEINEDILTDWRFVTAIADSESDDEAAALVATSTLVRLTVGKDGEKKLMDHVKREDGIIPMESVKNEIVDIFRIIGDRKKIKN